MNSRTLVVLVSLLTASCTVGPNFVRPAAPGGGYVKSAPAPTVDRSVTVGGDAADDWYRLFDSAELDRLVRSALAHNPDIVSELPAGWTRWGARRCVTSSSRRRTGGGPCSSRATS